MINKKLAKSLKDIKYGFFISYFNNGEKIEIFKHNVNNFITISRSSEGYFIPLVKLTYLDLKLIEKTYTDYEFKFYNMYNLFLLNYLYKEETEWRHI